MSNRDDESYFRMRARREREIAGTCEDNAVAMAHFTMADAYERRLRAEVKYPSIDENSYSSTGPDWSR